MKLDDSSSLSELVVSHNKFSNIWNSASFFYFHILKRSLYKIYQATYNIALMMCKDDVYSVLQDS